MRRRYFAAVIAVVAGGLIAGATPTIATAAPAPKSELRWGACPADATAPGLQCSTLSVPLDYADPDGRKIDVAISRLASAKPSQRRGVLLTNPGGPGGEGLTFPALLKRVKLPQSVLDSYDVIGMDPRGVGHSTPVTCGLKPEQIGTVTTPAPYARNPLDVAAQAKSAKAVAKQCDNASTAALLPYMSTKNTARDMDQIRAAFGEPKMSYLGYSYGTYLGAVYTTMFPKQSDRIVLDSSLGPKGLDVTGTRRLGLGVQIRFPDFAKFAAANPKYGLGTTQQAVTAKYFSLAAKLDAKPSQDGLNGALFRQLTFGNLYGDGQFDTLAKMWQALDANKPVPPPPGPAPDPKATENTVTSRLAVVCNDSNWPKSVASYQLNVAIDRIRYPLFGAAGANINPCAFWSAKSKTTEPPVTITDRGPANVVIAQNVRDPATPPIGAGEMRRALGKRASMVTTDAGGHGSYVLNGNTCTEDVVTWFLVNGNRPNTDTTCAAQPAKQPTASQPLIGMR